MEDLSPLIIVLRLANALAMGAIVGWTRERRDKPAGIRTHMMVALGAATFVVLSLYVDAQSSGSAAGARIDPSRVLHGVVGGIGFLGAGTIIQARGRVSGITTAAAVWVCGGLGAAAGIGAYSIGWLATLGAFLTLISPTSVIRKPRASTAAREQQQQLGSEPPAGSSDQRNQP